MNAKTTELKIEGMSCQNCVKHVTNALQNVPGVTKVNVSLEENKGVVVHDETVNPETLIAAVEGEGYPASKRAS
jgi:copper chaperone